MSLEDEMQSQHAEGRWKKDEHDRFLIALMRYGKDWKKVEEEVQTRNGPQVRSHSQKFFLKLHKINKDRRKHKNREQTHRTETQEEILTLFSEDHITKNTPTEMIAVIRNEVIPYRNHAQKPKPVETKELRGGQQHEKSSQDPIIQEDSYFSQFIINKAHFQLNQDFTDLIEFQKNTGDDDSVPKKQRKNSFTLYEDESLSQMTLPIKTKIEEQLY